MTRGEIPLTSEENPLTKGEATCAVVVTFDRQEVADHLRSRASEKKNRKGEEKGLRTASVVMDSSL